MDTSTTLPSLSSFDTPSPLPDLNTSSASDFLGSLDAFSIIGITCNAFCFVAAVAILVLRRHAFQMLLIIGPFVPGLVTVSSVAELSSSLGSFKTGLLSLSAGVLVSVVMWVAFYFIPSMGPCCFFSLLLMSFVILIECAADLSLGLIAIIVPVFFALLLVLVVYSVARVPMIRGKEFTWPDSAGVALLHTTIACFAAGFGFVTSLMFFIDPDHTNLMSIMQRKLNHDSTADPNKSSTGLACWIGASVIIGVTRTESFDRVIVWIWQRVKRCRRKSDDSKTLLSDSATEFGAQVEDEAASLPSDGVTNCPTKA